MNGRWLGRFGVFNPCHELQIIERNLGFHGAAIELAQNAAPVPLGESRLDLRLAPTVPKVGEQGGQRCESRPIRNELGVVESLVTKQSLGLKEARLEFVGVVRVCAQWRLQDMLALRGCRRQFLSDAPCTRGILAGQKFRRVDQIQDEKGLLLA